MEEKLCNKCKVIKNADFSVKNSDFYSRNFKFLQPCKECRKATWIEWFEKNQDYYKKWQRDNVERMRSYSKTAYSVRKQKAKSIN